MIRDLTMTYFLAQMIPRGVEAIKPPKLLLQAFEAAPIVPVNILVCDAGWGLNYGRYFFSDLFLLASTHNDAGDPTVVAAAATTANRGT